MIDPEMLGRAMRLYSCGIVAGLDRENCMDVMCPMPIRAEMTPLRQKVAYLIEDIMVPVMAKLDGMKRRDVALWIMASS